MLAWPLARSKYSVSDSYYYQLSYRPPYERSSFLLLCFFCSSGHRHSEKFKDLGKVPWPPSQKDGAWSQAGLVAQIILCPLSCGGKEMTMDYGPSSDCSLPTPLLPPHSRLVVGVEINDLRGSFQYVTCCDLELAVSGKGGTPPWLRNLPPSLRESCQR